MPELAKKCIESWHKYMPNWQYMEWNERTIADYCKKNNFQLPLISNRYCKEAFMSCKYAFVSDYIRLWVLENEGGVYMDVDFEVYKSLEPLLDCKESAFVGREGSKRQPVMLGVMSAEVGCPWITEMREMYDDRVFIKPDGTFDMTTNVSYFAASGIHEKYASSEFAFSYSGGKRNVPFLHIYPVDYFCPILTTGEDIRSENTYCEHKGLNSWSCNIGIKTKILSVFTPKIRTRLIKLKRNIFG